jgi:hypothetical protein
MADSTYVEATVGEILKVVQQQRDAPGFSKKADPPPIPLIDPTANVTAQLSGAIERINDLSAVNWKWSQRQRDSDYKWQKRVDDARDAAEERARVAERGRIDALRAGDAAAIAAALQTAATAALALQSQVTTSAQTLAAAAQLNKDTQDKAIAALQLVQASSGGTLQGREVQKSEGQDNSSRYLALAVAFLVALGTVASVIYTVHAVTGK